MQFLIQSSKLSLTTSRAKLAHCVLELKTTCFKKKNVLPTFVSTIPPWLLKRPNCNFSLCCYDKTTTNPEVFKCKFFELCSEFSHHVEIYTDGSKDEIRTAAAVVAPNSVKTVRLPDNASVHQINFTVCNRSLVAVLVRHWAATTQSSSTVFELVIQDLQTLIS